MAKAKKKPTAPPADDSSTQASARKSAAKSAKGSSRSAAPKASSKSAPKKASGAKRASKATTVKKSSSVTKTATKKTAAKKATEKKTTAKKTVKKKAAAKKVAAPKATAKKAASPKKKGAAKATPARKATGKRQTSTKTSAASKASRKPSDPKNATSSTASRKTASPKSSKSVMTIADLNNSTTGPARDQSGKVIPRVQNPPLTAKQKKELKQALIDERDRVLAFIAEVDSKSIGHHRGESERSRSSYSIHQADYASDNQSLNLTLMQRQIESQRLEAIEWALKRMGTKNFGKCRRCSANIGYERMQAVPYAEYCILCRADLETP